MPAKLRVIVVDDEPAAARTTGRLVEMLGHEAHVFESAAAVLEALEQIRPDVVLSDIGMPLMNGYELAKRLREASVGKGAILVAVTAYSEEEHRQQAVQAGFDYRLVKPMSADELQNLLEEVAAELNKA